ncbi:MAG: toll/interleukin-1 receptor domain-containing protein [Acetatifactor sp.]|nr:toll/interleukin-1 receptor domain-containing protein [Acetatifactor sp.]MDE7112822.1 toll/interleukin-1 receptor domain-containing protein [Acetatifactor sp.]
MSKGVKETQIQYDAFISYRHCPEDKRVAERLQRLLEKCRIVDADTGKKRYLHIFRDQSELPTSNDLGTSIRTALENSRFLIILYSRTTKESKWCMEELNYFRFLHHNTNQNILPMLLEGEPDEVFPDILRWEPRQIMDEDGESRSVQVEVEPLGADIRAGSYHAKQKKLCRTEYMRIAAPIMGCRYDDLYRRAFRQKVRNGVLVGGIMFLICFLIALLFVNQYHSKLTKAAVYQVMAGQYADKKDWQSALMYYNEAMKRDTSLDSASLAAALLLQERQWPCVMHIDEHQYIGENGALWSFEEVQHIEASAQEDLLVRDCNRDYYLCKYSGIVDRYAVYDREGGRTAVLENVGYIMFDSFGQDYWGFYQDGMVTLYEPSEDAFCSFSIDWSTEYKGLVHVIPAGEDACLVMNEEEDSIALYQISFADGKGQLVEKVFLDQLFKERYEKEREVYGQTAAGSFLFQVSPRQDAVIVGRTVADIDDSWSDVIVLQLPDLTCKTLISDEHYYLNKIAFRADGGRFALAHGNGTGTLYAGGYAAVYELSGEVEFRTEIDEDCAYYRAVFRDEESGEIVL